MPNPWNLKWQLGRGKDLIYKSHEWLSMTCEFLVHGGFIIHWNFFVFLTALQIAWIRSNSHEFLSKSHEPNDKKMKKIVQKQPLALQTGKAPHVALMSCSWWETSLQGKASHDSPPKGKVPDHETDFLLWSQDVLLWSFYDPKKSHNLWFDFMFYKVTRRESLDARHKISNLEKKHSIFFCSHLESPWHGLGRNCNCSYSTASQTEFDSNCLSKGIIFLLKMLGWVPNWLGQSRTC